MAKLLPSSNKGNSSIVKVDKIISSSLVKKSIQPISKEDSSENVLLGIQKKIIKVDSVLKDSLLLKKKVVGVKRKETEQEKFKKREKQLEKQKPQEIKGIQLPSLPKLGLFDWIKNFVFNTFLGFVAVRIIDHLPKLIKLTPIIFKVGDFIIDWGGKLLDGMVTFVDKAYDVVDNTRKFAKQLGGEGLAQNFDKFAGALSTMMDVAIIAAMSAASMSGDEGGGFGGRGGSEFRDPRKGFKGKQGWNLSWQRAVNPSRGFSHLNAERDIMKRYFQRFGRDKFIQRFGEEGLEKLPKSLARSGLTKFGRRAFVGMLGKGGAKSVLGFIRPFLKRIPIPVVGALIDFGISWALGEDPGRAAFRAIGAGILGTIGGGLAGVLGLAGGPLAIATAALGSLAGGTLGDMAGGAIYDLFFGGKKTKGKVAKAAGGGQPTTRGGKLVSGPKRRIKKKKIARTLNVTPKKLKPGSAVGGEKKIKKLFPESEDKRKMSPFEFLKKTYDVFSKSSGLDALIALGIKPLMGDKPTIADYKNAGMSINNWMNQSISPGTLAYAGGGEVKIESVISGEDYSNVIAKTLQESVTPQVDKTIQDLMRQLTLKEIDRGKESGEKTTGEEEPGGSPTLTGNTNAEKVFRYLVDKEGFTPEAAAGVIGNLMQESGVNPKSRQNGGGPGRGIMQWTESERWASLSAWANNSGKDPWALETQVQWMIKEMKSYGTYNRIKGVSSYKKAVEIFESEMERAGTPNYPRRYEFAADALASFSGGAGGGGTGGSYTQLSNNPDAKRGSKLAGELGRFLDKKGLGGWGSGVHQHPEHPPWNRESGHSAGSLHYASKGARAIDIGGYGRSRGYSDQDQILAGVAEFNRMKGIKPVQLLKDGYPGHDNHVHVAYARGGKTKGIPHFAMLGEKGREFVIDADSTAALENTFPGFLDAINRAKYKEAVSVLRRYTDYERPEPQIIEVPVPVEVFVPVPIGGGPGMIGGGSIDNTDYETLEML